MENKGFIAFFCVIFLLIVGMIVAGVSSAAHVQTMQCTVEEKDRTRSSDGTSDARIYTEDCGVLSVSDSLLDGTFSSSDTYAKIKPGERYEFKTRGKRIPILSWFPNIVEVRPI